jgi:Ca-activated chloride channel homolog
MSLLTLIEQFTFIRTDYLWLIPIIVILFFILNRVMQSKTDWDSIIAAELQPYLLNKRGAQTTAINTWPLVAACIACLIACFCLAGPSWEKVSSPVEKNSHAMVVIADLTLSMHTSDIKPSRLVRMRYKILELLKRNRDRQIALVVYSGDAHIVSPLTDDANNIAALVPSLTPEIMPSIGSNADAAFTLAEQLLEQSAAKQNTLVWLTDEVLASQTDSIVKKVGRQDAQLFIIGVGTEQGGPVVLPSGKFVKTDRGRIVNAPMSRDRLMAISTKTQGQYFDLQGDNSDIDRIFEQDLSLGIRDATAGTTDKESRQQIDQQYDRGAYFAIALLPFVLLSFRRGWLLSLLLSVNLMTTESVWATEKPEQSSFEWQDLWQTDDQQGEALFNQQAFSEATETFDRADWRGLAAFKAKNYDAAIEQFSHAIDSPGQQPNSLANLHYNLGHSFAHSQDFESAINAYGTALSLNPNLEQAKTAKALLEQLQKQQQQQKQQDQQGQQENANQQDSSDTNSAQSSNTANDANPSNNSENASESSEQQTGSNDKTEDQQNALLDQQAQRAANKQQQEQSTEQTGNPNQPTEKQIEQPSLKKNESVSDSENQGIGDEQDFDPQRQAELEQWLQKIPDDPGGLLRRKFNYQRQVNEQRGQYLDNNEEGQLW